MAGSGAGFGIVAGTGTGKTLAIRPIAESMLGETLRSASSTASARRRRRRRAGTSSSSPPASRAAGSRTTSSRPRHPHRRRDPPDVRRAGAVPRARQARRLPLHLALGDGGPDVLRPLPRERGRPGDLRVRPGAPGEGPGAAADARRVPRRQVPPPRDEGAARRRGVRADAGRGRAAGGGPGREVEARSTPRSTTAASRSASSGRSSRERWSGRSSSR